LNLEGVILAGYLGSLTIGDVLNGADIITGASTSLKAKTNITAGVIADGTAITVAGPVGKLTATKVGAGTITAPSIGAITTKGATKPAVIAGDFGSAVTVSGAGVLAGKPAIGKVSVAGSVLAGADLTAPSIGSITAKGDFAADITLSGAGIAAGKPVLGSVKVGRTLAGSTIDVTGAMTGLTAGAITDTTITANSLGSLRVIGAKAKAPLPALTGDATNLDVNLAGAGVPTNRPTLGTFSVSGTVLNSDVAVGGNVTAVSALAFRGSNFYVGFAGTEAGVGTFLPIATLKSFTVKGVTDAFRDSNVIASSIGTVTLKSVDTDNGGTKFGLISDSTIKSVKIAIPTGFIFNPFGQTFGPDFEIRLV
jgi:hypothetical protein